MKQSRNKKSQMEIMGLAIVVVLLVLGMLFAIKFVLFQPQQTYRKEYTETQLAANMLNTMLNTNTNCNDLSIGELLQDASKAAPDILNCPGPTNSEVFVKEKINNLLTQLNQKLKKEYHFKAYVPGKDVVEIGPVYTNRTRERKTHFLPTDVGTMKIILDIYG